ncbi:MAG: hypothetical protein EBV03_10625, partial [Proteobacteria bacterium]|nr:hypothetical protein [Pseudomonadota bacterium]
PACAGEYAAHWSDVAPQLDGSFNEDAWQRAQSLTQFHTWRGGETDARQWRMLWCEDGLYFAAIIHDADIQAFGSRHNDTLWHGDVIELFLRPDAARPGYYEFQVNPKGQQLEFFIAARGAAFEQLQAQPPLGMRSVAVKIPGGWQVEGSIPWGAFSETGGIPEPGDAWRFNVAYFDHDRDRKEAQLGASAALNKPDFHRTEEYDTLRFLLP